MGALALTYRRFRFAHPVARSRWNPFRRRDAPEARSDRATRAEALPDPTGSAQIHIRDCPAANGHCRLDVIFDYREESIGLTLVAVLALGSAFFSTEWFRFLEENSLLATTAEVLTFYTPPLGSFQTIWIVIPLLIVFYAGELIWKERDAGVNEMVNASPVPEWVLFIGKFLGLALVIVVWLACFMVAGMLIQVYLGHPEFERRALSQGALRISARDLPSLRVARHRLARRRRSEVSGHCCGTRGLRTDPVSVDARPPAQSAKLWCRSWLVVLADARRIDPTVGPWLWFKLYGGPGRCSSR